MTNNHIALINELIGAIKTKESSKSSFDAGILFRWELLFCITLEIVSYELKRDGRISDETAAAIEKPFVFQCFEYYKNDFPEIYATSGRVFDILLTYNLKLNTDTLDHRIKDTVEWNAYITLTIKRFITP